jgi:exodeoxyribonuclease-3
LKIISFNTNGIRAALNKGLFAWLETTDADIVCIQETKAQPEQIDTKAFESLGYHCYINSAEKKGYSGTAIFTKIKALTVSFNFNDEIDIRNLTDNYGNIAKEGRIITAEFDDFFLITTYVPNVKSDLTRLDIREKQWDKILLEHISILEKRKPVVICGDLNVAHKAIDLTYPKQNEGNAGYTKEERQGFENFMQYGLVDIFRQLHPDTVKYTWWSMRTRAKDKNIGWRIDYFLCSNSFMDKIIDSEILDYINMSDHCPVLLEVKD